MTAQLICDTEIYSNYFLVMFRNIATGNVKYFERFNDGEFDVLTVKKILHNNQIITFNGRNFDMPILTLACEGADNAEIKKMCDAIIVGNLKGWQAADKFGIRVFERVDHIDVFEVAPGIASLKMYGGRLHTKTMRDLPVEPSAVIDETTRAVLRDEYCPNDLIITQELYNYLKPQIDLRTEMGKIYNEDLRSKSDAQIAEAVIKSRLSIDTGVTPKRPEIAGGTAYLYKAPAFVSFQSSTLRKVLAEIEASEFLVADSGKIVMPKSLTQKDIAIGASTFRMGIGGLHSTESKVALVAGATHAIIDRDVASYYPAIILTCQLFPKHLGRNFLTVYKSLVDKRLEAKNKGEKVTADTLKIVVNGSFGKLGSKWSALYAPDLMVHVTLTGQLCLLMLIEMLEDQGIRVVSANTDGVVMYCTKEREHLVAKVVHCWELMTGFETEETRYEAYYGRDVNNYIAIKSPTAKSPERGLVKLKGEYAPPTALFGSWPNPANEICVAAVINYLVLGLDIETTIRECRDIKQFVTIRTVKGGALKDGAYLGKAIRWYYSTKAAGVIQYKINGYTVARTEGAMPCMTLPDSLPEDVNYDWYVNEARSMLKDLGVDSPC